MNMAKKLYKKDKYGLLRGCIFAGVLAIVCVSLSSAMQLRHKADIESKNAASVAMHCAHEFDNMLMEKMSVLYDALRNPDIYENTEAELCAAGGFAYIEKNSSAGSKNMLVSGRDGRIGICAKGENGEALTGWLESEQIESIFSGAGEIKFPYAVYNTQTGDYLINNSQLESTGYYDAISKLDEGKAAEPLMVTDSAQSGLMKLDGRKVYIAQQASRFEPWAVSLVLPQNLVSENLDNNYIFWIIILNTVLILAILILYTLLALRRIGNSNRNAAEAVLAGERMMKIASSETHTTLAVYRRDSASVLGSYDGMHLFGEGMEKRPFRSLADLKEVCKLSETEYESLIEYAHKIKAGEKIELIVRTTARGADERSIMITLNASPEDKNNIIISIRDCTRSQLQRIRAEQEKNYENAMRRKCSCIWQINISRNRWRAVYCRENDRLHRILEKTYDWRDYNADMQAALRDYLYPADYENYTESMGIVELASAYHNGRTEMSLDYRITLEEGNYEWHRMRIRLWMDPKSTDIIANLYIINVNAEKNAELERGERKRILRMAQTALGASYDALYYVDLDKDLSYTARSVGTDLVTRLSAPYKSTFDNFIDTSVHQDDRDALRSMLSAYNLRRNMTEGTHFQRCQFRRRVGDGYDLSALILQPARFENGIVKEIVLAIRFSVGDE